MLFGKIGSFVDGRVLMPFLVNKPQSSLCKGTGWIEVLGGGVVNKKVLENCNIDSTKYSGLAFGIGIERIAMALNEASP